MPKVKKSLSPPESPLDQMADGIKVDALGWVRLFQIAAGCHLKPEDEQALVAVGVRTSPADRDTILRLLRK